MKKLFHKMWMNFVVFILLLILVIAGYPAMRNTMLKNSQTLGDSLARSYSAERISDLNTYETLLSFGSATLHSKLESGDSEVQLEKWLRLYSDRLQMVLGEGAVDTYAVVDGKILAATPWEHDNEYDYNQTDWYRRAIEADGQIIFTEVYTDAISGRPIITLAQKCSEDGEVLAFDVFPENFKFGNTPLELPKDTSFFLCDPNGTLIYYQTDLTQSKEEIQNYIYRVRGQIIDGKLASYDDSVEDLNGTIKGAYYYTMPNGWLSIVTIPFSAILKDLQMFTLIFAGVFSTVFVSLLAFTWRDLKNNAVMERTNETVRVLGNSYYALYRVNFTEGTYEMIKGSDYMRSRIPPKGPYSEMMDAIDGAIDPNSLKEYKESFSLSNIRSLVTSRTRDFGGDFLRKFGNEYRWVNIRVLFDESLSPDEVVLCFKEVGQEKERQMKERELLELSLDSALKSEKSKQAFFSNMSHDMRTPLNAIVNLSALAEHSVDNKEKTLEYLKKINYSSCQLLHLINDILDMSRMEQGKIILHNSSLDLRQCIEDCLMPFAIQAEREGKTLETDFEISHPIVSADTMRISQIMNNLLSNAFKFTEKGDTVRVSISQVGEKEQVKFKIVISDTGIGISEEFLPHLFEPYARETRFTSHSTIGTGLGMPIVKNLVEQMNGRIYVESKLGEGTSFTLVLPFLLLQEAEKTESESVKSEELVSDEPVSDELVPEKTLEPSPASSPLSGCHILLAEDNEINMEVMKEILSMDDINVTEAWNGKEAVEIFKNSEPFFFDAILMDMQMPVMGGCDAARAIRKLERADASVIPIIAVTANAFAEDLAATSEAGMDAHISKPIDIDILHQTLEKQLHKKSNQ